MSFKQERKQRYLINWLLFVVLFNHVTAFVAITTTTPGRRIIIGRSNNVQLWFSSSGTPASTSSTTTFTASSSSSSSSSLHPKVGDIVRYYDLDGGKADGQVLIGKITYIFGGTGGGTITIGEGDNHNNNDEVVQDYIVEVTQLEDVQDGYYAEYSSSKRMNKKKERKLSQVSPILASFVQSEQAYKVPMMKDTNNTGRLVPKVRQEIYDLQDYSGPISQSSLLSTDVLAQDEIKYQQLKIKLLKNSAIVGLIGTIVVNIVQGTEDACIYFAGVMASLFYLFFLSLKTDTVAMGNDTNRRLSGSPFATLRFFMPVFVLIGVAIYNQSKGEANPLLDSNNVFDTVTTEQFAFAVLGFLTYRVPLFVGQIQDALAEFDQENTDGNTSPSSTILPGSTGIALKALQNEKSKTTTTQSKSKGSDESLTTILLVAGPQSTGRSELVAKLLKQDDRLVAPNLILRRDDGATFERLERRDEFLQLDNTKSSGITKNSILQAATDDSHTTKKVVVIDANVELAKKLQTLSGTRLIGVWVGLQSVSDFEKRIETDIDNGTIEIPPDETKESMIRARIKDIINEIEYGLSSGIFEFTILNQNPEQSLKELKEAAAYAFK